MISVNSIPTEGYHTYRLQQFQLQCVASGKPGEYPNRAGYWLITLHIYNYYI